MNALPALTPTPGRAATAPAGDGGREGGSGDFAAALDVACGSASAGTKARPSPAESKAPRAKADTHQAARADDAAADQASADDTVTDDAPDADDHGLMPALPGWPANVEAATLNGPSSPNLTNADKAPGDFGTVPALAEASARASGAAPDAVIAPAPPVVSAAPAATAARATPTARAARALPDSGLAPAASTALATPKALAAREQPQPVASQLPAATPVPPLAAAAIPAPTGVSTAAVDRLRATTGQAAAAAAIDAAAPPVRSNVDRETLTTAPPLSSALPATGSAAPTPPASGPPFEAHLAAALDSPAFAPALASQITWLVHDGQQHARLTLNPAEMGPVTVKIVLDGNQARVDFSADMVTTRSAIEASLPALAAALHDSGLTLTGGGVFDGQPRHGAQHDPGTRQPGPGGAASPSPREPAPALPHAATRGLVDLVA